MAGAPRSTRLPSDLNEDPLRAAPRLEDRPLRHDGVQIWRIEEPWSRTPHHDHGRDFRVAKS
jgi:hypothetical protein